MMREYKRYDEYKDSGVEWIGEIPVHWVISKIKYEYIFFTGFTPPSGNDSYYDINGYDWLNISDIKNKYIYKAESKISDKAIKEYRPKISKKGNLIFSFKLSIGKTAILKRNIYTNEALATFKKSNNNDIKYLYYIAPIFIPKNAKENIYGAKILNQRLINDALLLKPSNKEQQKIASFLDQKTAKIDEIINKKEKLINSLEKYKKSVITEAVTKAKLGDKYINEDGELVDNIEMRDSGIEWLGEIPEYWDIKRLKFVVDEINEKWDKKSFYEYIGLENIESDGGKLTGTQSSENINSAIKFKKNDVLFNTLRPYLKKCIVADFEGVSTSEMLILRGDNILPQLLSHIMLSNKFIELVNSSTYGAKMPRANWDFIGNIYIPIINKFIQKEIIDFLDYKISSIYSLIQKTKESIEKYKEYKKSLIFEAVTGKIDLRDFELKGGEELAEHNNSSETKRERISAVN